MSISLRAARVNAGLSQKELAEKMAKNAGTIHNWETGKTSIPMHEFERLCKILNIGKDQIFLPTRSS